MKKVFGVFLMVWSFVVIVSLTSVCAQEAAPAMPAADAVLPAEEDKFSFGRVVAVADGLITVKEYDFAKDADIEVGYAVTAETEFGNINTAADLKVDDDIVIDYVEKDGKRVVTTLVKEEKDAAELPVLNEGDTVMPAEAVPAEDVPVNAEPVQK